MLVQLVNQSVKPKPCKVFYSYSHSDEELRNEFDLHLRELKREGFISTWHDREIRPGMEWSQVINDNINTADVIFLLISDDFLESTYCREIEIKRAMERYEKGEAILIPILLKPSSWLDKEFAKIQPLPRNCKPLVEWPDKGFTQVAEELRVIFIDLVYPKKPVEFTGGQHANWILKLRSQPNMDSHSRTLRLIKMLQEYTNDFTISLQATTDTQIVENEKIKPGLMLILNGKTESFAIIDRDRKNGNLSIFLGEEIVSFYIFYGASIMGSSNYAESPPSEFEDAEGLILYPGKEFSPLVCKALLFSSHKPSDLTFIFDYGDEKLDADSNQDNNAKLIEYFSLGMTTKADNLWVNLSAYETDRMLPKALEGTNLGRVMLSQDCMLKRITASFMHPDSPIGRVFWDAVYEKAHHLFGTSKISYRSFQKVCISPCAAAVYEKKEGEPYEPSFLKKFDFLIDDQYSAAAFITKAELDVTCEKDLVAEKHNNLEGIISDSLFNSQNDFILSLFSKHILPHLRHEVNKSEYFAPLRQVFHSMILAGWFKHYLPREKKYSVISELIDTDKSNMIRITRMDKEINDSAFNKKENAANGCHKKNKIDHLTPNASAFDIPENVEYYEQYIKLFRNGLYKCARNEKGDSPDEQIIRVYFSGAIRLCNLF